MIGQGCDAELHRILASSDAVQLERSRSGGVYWLPCWRGESSDEGAPLCALCRPAEVDEAPMAGDAASAASAAAGPAAPDLADSSAAAGDSRLQTSPVML